MSVRSSLRRRTHTLFSKQSNEKGLSSYRTTLPDGEVGCVRYEEKERGVELYIEDDQLIAFVPYPNPIGLLTEDANLVDERSIM